MLLQEVIIQTRQALQEAPYQLFASNPPLEHFQLTPEISITILKRRIADHVMDCCDPRLFGLPDPVRQSPQLYAFVRTNPVSMNIWDWQPDQTLELCMALSRLVHPTSFPLTYHAKISLDANGTLAEVIPLQYHARQTGAWISPRSDRDWLTEADAVALKPLVGRLPLHLPKRISRAFWFNEFAARNYFAEVRWTLVATGLEALIHTDRHRSGYQFSTRTAKLAAHVGISAFSEDQAARYYDMRSQIAHGQGLKQLTDFDNESYQQAEDVLRLTLRKAILDSALAATFNDSAAVIQNWAR